MKTSYAGMEAKAQMAQAEAPQSMLWTVESALPIRNSSLPVQASGEPPLGECQELTCLDLTWTYLDTGQAHVRTIRNIWLAIGLRYSGVLMPCKCMHAYVPSAFSGHLGIH